MIRSTPKYLLKTASVGVCVGIGLAGVLAFFLMVLPACREVGEYAAADMSGDPRHGLANLSSIGGFAGALFLGMALGAFGGGAIGFLRVWRRRGR